MFERGFHPCGGWWELVMELIVEGRQFLSVYLKWKKEEGGCGMTRTWRVMMRR